MGTRASFFLGDPRDVDNRVWLGCVAWDGYEWADNGEGDWIKIKSEADFLQAIKQVQETREDFANPSGGFPFPWIDDLFLTDYTYAFMNGEVYVACFHSSLTPLREWEGGDKDDPSMLNVPAPKGYWDRSQPDSIMIFMAKKNSE